MKEEHNQDFQFIFIVGASGSGTTMLLRLLSTPPDAMSLGGNYISIPNNEVTAVELVRTFNEVNKIVWDRYADFENKAQARLQMSSILQRLLSLPGYDPISDVIFKRSAPFFVEDRYRPDLSDLLQIFPSLKILAIYRNPRASTASSLARGFAEHLRRCAVITEEQLTYLSAQLSTLPADLYHVLSYEDLCTHPHCSIKGLAGFLGKPPQELIHAAGDEIIRSDRINAWKRELDRRSIEYLEEFFDERRCQQWSFLARQAQSQKRGTG